MGIFDIFGDIATLSKSNDITKLNGVDMSKVTREEFDDAMDFLDGLRDNDLVSVLLGDEYINKFKEELQTKWDMTHEEPEPEPKNVPTGNTVESQIDKLVDEYMDSLDIPNDSLMQKLVPMAKESYKKFAEFIYNHE